MRVEFYEFRVSGLCERDLCVSFDYEVNFFVLFKYRINFVFFVNLLVEFVWLVFCFIVEGNEVVLCFKKGSIVLVIVFKFCMWVEMISLWLLGEGSC